MNKSEEHLHRILRRGNDDAVGPQVGRNVNVLEEQAVHRAPKITYIHIPIPDSRPISAQKFEDIMFAMAIGVRRGNLLVHCLAGMSRSPILIAAWLHRCGYAGIDKALSEIAQLRDLAPSQTLLRSVKDLVSK